ncbi:biopolymer transporter ExbD [Deltaproteobacteria bacterium TL4]
MNVSPWQENESLSEINVTPFVDVLLVLLIIFMVTAPVVHHVIQVDLPEESYNRDNLPVQKPIRVIIDQNGVLYVNDDLIGFTHLEEVQEKLQQRLLGWSQSQSEPYVDIEADTRVRYGSIVPVIARLKEMGIALNLIIKPKAKH